MSKQRSFDLAAGPEDLDIQELLQESRLRRARRLRGREGIAELGVSLAFLLVAIPLALLVDSGHGWTPWAIPLLAAYVVASRVHFEVGTGTTVPTQLFFVPMLFAMPVGSVPLMVALCFVAGRVPDYISGKARLDHAIVETGDAWHAVGPAAVFALAGVGGPEWADWPVYVGALVAQFAFDLASSATREWLERGLSPKVQLRVLGWVHLVDAALAPVGLLLAFAWVDAPYAIALLLPLVGLLAVFAADRNARINHALELSDAYRGTAMLLGEVIEADDEATGLHTKGVTLLATMVAEEMELDARTRQQVEFTGLLHDVGKLALPNEIIAKAGPLNEGEWELMRTHTIEGQRMLDRVGGALGEVGTIVRATHERWDGSGYPDGLRAEQIPLAARIVSCCDAYDAMTNDRSYRRALPLEFAIAELHAGSGTQFDPGVVAALVAIVRRFEPELTDVATPSAEFDEALRRLLQGT